MDPEVPDPSPLSMLAIVYPNSIGLAQDLPEPSSLLGMYIGTKAAENKGCNLGMQHCKLIDANCNLEMCLATLSVASSGI